MQCIRSAAPSLREYLRSASYSRHSLRYYDRLWAGLRSVRSCLGVLQWNELEKRPIRRALERQNFRFRGKDRHSSQTDHIGKPSLLSLFGRLPGCLRDLKLESRHANLVSGSHRNIRMNEYKTHYNWPCVPNIWLILTVFALLFRKPATDIASIFEGRIPPCAPPQRYFAVNNL